LILLAALLALAPAGTVDGRWVSVGEDGNGATWWLDAETSPLHPGTGEAWFKVVPATAKHSNLLNTMIHVSIVCSSRQYALLATVTHYKDGRTTDDELGSAYQSPAPDTVGEWIVKLFCKNS
jgi:hypothetical protein